MTPQQAYKIVKKKAKEAGMTITDYCVKKGVSPATVSRWKKKSNDCTIMMSAFSKLTN